MISPKVTPGEPLTFVQKLGLEWTAHLHGGKDVVLAIDLTGSVGLNDSGRNRLTQIVDDSLSPGDSLYIVPFATKADIPKDVIQYQNKTQIPEILNAIPVQADSKLANTDIQQAELAIYQHLAQQNQDRLAKHQPIKSQSIVWITDAPLFTNLKAPCKYSSSQNWIETPANSPFRHPSPENQSRQDWIKALCPVMEKRSLQLGSYNLSVVDIAPTVQESCTPAPGGNSICLVNPYLFEQLWVPGLLLTIGTLIFCGGAIRFFSWRLATQKKWRLSVTFDSQPELDEKICYLPSNKSIGIGGGDDSNCIDIIDCPDSEVRAYLVRRGNRLYLEPTGAAPIYWGEREITKRTRLNGTRLQLNCPDRNGLDFYLNIKISQ